MIFLESGLMILKLMKKQCIGIFKHTQPTPSVYRFTIDI